MVTSKSGADPLQSFPPTTAAHPQSQQPLATSPPSKRDLASWWRQFKRNTRKDEPKDTPPRGIFGVPLNVSIKYANVAISLTNDTGSFIYGYVPIVVAKCGVFLKEKATDVEGIFRLNGSAKRIKDLQEMFDSPERYGKGLDWTGYTVHDAANVLRRYLNQLPEPIVPLEFYERFREPLRTYQKQMQDDAPPESHTFDHAHAVEAYQGLIRELPPLNKQLLLYILDLLAVFASKSEQNRMTSANLSAIFQPGLLSHPQHDMSPDEYKLSQDVLIFLIENQDHFLFGMNGTAADEQTVKEVEGGVARRPTNTSSVRRSVSNASGGADSFRKYESLRRNVSVSSKNSRNSTKSGPGTPTGLGVHRSNTLPSKMSPAIPPSRVNRVAEGTTGLNSNSPSRSSAQHSRSPSQTPPANEETLNTPREPGTGFVYVHSSTHGPMLKSPSQAPTPEMSPEARSPASSPPPPSAATPARERKLSNLFSKSPEREPRQPNRLRKKNIPGSASESAQSSSQSLQGVTSDHGVTSAPQPSYSHSEQQDIGGVTPRPPYTVPDEHNSPDKRNEKNPVQEGSSNADTSLKPYGSRTPSMNSNSRSSFTDYSDADPTDETSRERTDHRRSWRFHRSSKRSSEQVGLGLASPPVSASNPGADRSTSSIGSWRQSSRSSPSDLQQFMNDPSYQPLSLDAEVSNNGSGSGSRETPEPERRSLFGKFKAKVAQVRDGVKESSDRDRTRSPPVYSDEQSASSHTLSPTAKDRVRSASMTAPSSREPSQGPVRPAQPPPIEPPKESTSQQGHVSSPASPLPGAGLPPAIPEAEEPRTPEKQQNGPGAGAGAGAAEKTPEPSKEESAAVPAAPETGKTTTTFEQSQDQSGVPLPTAESHTHREDDKTSEFLGS